MTSPNPSRETRRGSHTRRTILLIHGFPLDSRMWAGQAELAEIHDLVTPDLPGFGQTPPLAGNVEMAQFARAVEAAIDAAGAAKVVLGGLSMGGYILFECWRRFPERIEALAFCDTRAEEDDATARAGRLAGIDLVTRGRRDEFLDGFLDRLVAPDTKEHDAHLASVAAMARTASTEGIAAALGAMSRRPDSVELLASIHVPTLVCVGQKDALTPPAAARVIADGIPGARLVEIPEGGHMAPMENPAVFNTALRELLESLP